MGRLRIQGFLVTSGPIAAYGGLAIAEELMEDIANAVRQGRAPFMAQHDARRRLDVQVLDVAVRRTQDGHLGVWVDVEVDEAEWDKAGAVGGWSVAVIEPRFEAADASGRAVIRLSVDAAHFAEQLLAEATEALRNSNFEVQGGLLYQFAVFPPPNVVIEFSLYLLRDLTVGVLAAALYEGLRRLLKPRHASRTVFDFRIHEGDQSVHAHLETGDPEVLKDALDRLPNLIDREGKGFEYDDKNREWRGYL